MCGITFALTVMVIFEHGISISIKDDRQRQKTLNLLCFLSIATLLPFYGLLQTFENINALFYLVMVFWPCIMWGLVILNHNTFVRAVNLVPSLHISRITVDRFCYVLYLLPPIALIPIWMALQETWGTGKPPTASIFQLYFRYLSIVLIILTEILATISDYSLMKKVLTSRSSVASGTKQVSQKVSRNITYGYAACWLIMVADIIVKILIATGVVGVFDASITTLSLAVRARMNLAYGLELKNIYASQSGKSVQQSAAGNSSAVNT